MADPESPLPSAALRRAAEAALAARPESEASTRDSTRLLHELQVHQIELEMQNEALQRKNDELLAALSEQRIAAIIFETQQGVLVTDAAGTILRVNAAFSKVTGYSADEAIGKNPRFLQSGRQDADFYREMWRVLAAHGYWQGEIWNRDKHGRVYPAWMSISAVTEADGHVSHYVGAFSDISQAKESQKTLERMAHYDPLTGLPNRARFHDRLSRAMAGSRRSGRYGALLFLDLDNFKKLNDTRGHDVGDQLLVDAAGRLLACVREDDTVARLGGDEFVVLLEDLSTDAKEAALHVQQVGEKIRLSIQQAFDLPGGEFHCSASIGVGVFFDHVESADTLLKHADVAMYQAKSTGRNAVRFFDPSMQQALDLYIAMEADLRKAVEGGQLQLLYQAQVDSQQRVIGAEALLRWQHPARGMVAPDEFIPLAEETGLILPVGLWVLETACAQIRSWAETETTRELHLAVNVSARQFHQDNFVQSVLQALADSGANPHRLKLELTETVLLDNIDGAVAKMAVLKSHGVTFSLDDFGTGHSSLAYLSRLPLDQLKIDRSFVKELPHSATNAVISRTIISMASSMGLDVIAEGVESEAQRAFLESIHCPAYQGFLFSRPLSAEGFEALLTERPAGH